MRRESFRRARHGVCRILLVAAVSSVLVGGCATTQLKLADPRIAPVVGGSNKDYPAARFTLFQTQRAFFVPDNASDNFTNSVNLHAGRPYNVTITLPAEFERRRAEFLRNNVNGLQQAVGTAEMSLLADEHTKAKLMTREEQQARRVALLRAADKRAELAEAQFAAEISGEEKVDNSARLLELQVEVGKIQKTLADDSWLRVNTLDSGQMDMVRAQIETWKRKSESVRDEIVILENMCKDGSDALVRTIHGRIQVLNSGAAVYLTPLHLEIPAPYLVALRNGQGVQIAYVANNAPAVAKRGMIGVRGDPEIAALSTARSGDPDTLTISQISSLDLGFADAVTAAQKERRLVAIGELGGAKTRVERRRTRDAYRKEKARLESIESWIQSVAQGKPSEGELESVFAQQVAGVAEAP